MDADSLDNNGVDEHDVECDGAGVFVERDGCWIFWELFFPCKKGIVKRERFRQHDVDEWIRLDVLMYGGKQGEKWAASLFAHGTSNFWDVDE